jgi:hypothetical protein
MATKKSKSKKTNKIGQAEPGLSKPVLAELQHFLEYHPAERFSLNLRRLLLEFLQQDGAIESHYLNDLLYDLDAFFEFLHVAQSEGNVEQKLDRV